MATEKVPKPTSRTSSPLDSDLVMASNTPSTALEASLFDRPLESATALIRSFLFILREPPLGVEFVSVNHVSECAAVERVDAGLSKANPPAGVGIRL